MVLDLLQPGRRQRPLFSAELLLVYGSIAVFIAAHTIFWALGLFNSFGMTRVLDGTVPLFAVVALQWPGRGSCSWAGRRLPSSAFAWRRRGGRGCFFLLGTRQGFRWQRDFTRPPDQEVAEDAAAWMRQTYGPAARPLAYEVSICGHSHPKRPLRPQYSSRLSGAHGDQLDEAARGHAGGVGRLVCAHRSLLELAKLRADGRFRERGARRQAAQSATTRSATPCTVIVFERVR